jgi:hypothetical protein
LGKEARRTKKSFNEPQLRAWWGILKQFPNQPPFGELWFRYLKDTNSIIGQLRLMWIVLNQQKDKEQDYERRKSEIEYGGLFANPEVYFKVVKGDKEDMSSSGEAFKIVYDSSDFDRRLNLAMEGNPEIHEPRPDVAERIRAKREQIAEAKQNGIVLGVDEIAEEGLVIERKGG